MSWLLVRCQKKAKFMFVIRIAQKIGVWFPPMRKPITKGYLRTLRYELNITLFFPFNQHFMMPNWFFFDQLRVTSQTRLHALACRYNFVFCLDMSPSMASLDPLSGIFLLDHLRKVMEKCLQELVAEVKIGK